MTVKGLIGIDRHADCNKCRLTWQMDRGWRTIDLYRHDWQTCWLHKMQANMTDKWRPKIWLAWTDTAATLQMASRIYIDVMCCWLMELVWNLFSQCCPMVSILCFHFVSQGGLCIYRLTIYCCWPIKSCRPPFFKKNSGVTWVAKKQRLEFHFFFSRPIGR